MSVLRTFARAREISLPEWRCLLASRMRGEQTLRDVAEAEIEISPAQKRYYPPAIYFEHHLNNIISDHPEGVWSEQMERLRGGEREEKPTLAFLLRNVRLNSPGLFTQRWRYRFPAPKTDKPVVWAGGDEAAISSNFYGVKYFGHWVHDDICLRMLADDFAPPLSIRTRHWPDKAFYAGLFGQDWSPTDIAHLDKLYLFDDDGLTASRISRLRKMKQCVANRFPPQRAGAVVYLRRASGGINPRRLINEDEMFAAFKREGIEIVDLEKLETDAVITALSGAKIMITIEGSQQNHGMFALADGGGVVVINAPELFNTHDKQFYNALGYAFGLVVGEAQEEGFKVNVSELLSIVDKVNDRISQGPG